MRPAPSPNSADATLDAAGGCPTLRRSVFQFLDRYEALRLADVSGQWRDAASHPVAWLPTFIQYQRGQCTRSVTVATSEEVLKKEQQNKSRNAANSSPAVSAAASSSARRRSPIKSGRLSPDTGRRSPLLTPTSSGGVSPIQNNSFTGLGGAAATASAVSNSPSSSSSSAAVPIPYVPPHLAPDTGYGLFTPQARQHLARSAFGPAHVFSGSPIPGDVLAQLWSLGSPEIFFLVSQAFRRPPREMSLVLEHCDKLVGLSLASQASATVSSSVASMMVNVQSQIFLALELLCNPVYERKTVRRFQTLFPCAMILLRCTNVMRCATIEWKVPTALVNALNAPAMQYFERDTSGGGGGGSGDNSGHQQQQQKSSNVSGRHLSPVVLLLSEMLRWHDMEPLREHAPWFAALAVWASAGPTTVWTDVPFHPMFTMPHVLAIKSLAIAPPESGRSKTSSAAAAAVGSPSNNNNNKGNFLSAGGGGDSASSGQATPSNLSFSGPSNPQQQQQQQNQQQASASSPGDAALDGHHLHDEEMRELTVVRAMLRRNMDAEKVVKTVIHSLIEMAVFYYRKSRDMIPITPLPAASFSAASTGLPNTAGATAESSSSSSSARISTINSRERIKEEMTKRLHLVFHALVKVESLLPTVVWGTRSAVRDSELEQLFVGAQKSKQQQQQSAGSGTGYVEREVSAAWRYLSSGDDASVGEQRGINLLFEARGRLRELQAQKE